MEYIRLMSILFFLRQPVHMYGFKQSMRVCVNVLPLCQTVILTLTTCLVFHRDMDIDRSNSLVLYFYLFSYVSVARACVTHEITSRKEI